MSFDKKKRPFTQAERKMLFSLIEQVPIVQNKGTSAHQVEAKKLGWIKIEQHFNGSGVGHRSAQQLKRCWENIKTLRKKQRSDMSSESPTSAVAMELPNDVDPFEEVTVKVPIIDSDTYEDEPDIQTDHPANKMAHRIPAGDSDCIIPTHRIYVEDEARLRRERVQMQMQHEQEIHEVKMKREQEIHEVKMKREHVALERDIIARNLEEKAARLRSLELDVELRKLGH